MNDETKQKVIVRLLFIGLIVTAAWVIVALVRAPSNGGLLTPAEGSHDAVATVNGTTIDRLRYDRALAALSLEERGPELTQERRHDVLQALIDEELLLEQAARMNLHLNDRLIRRRLVNAMIDAFAARVDPELLSEKSLRAYYEKHSALFAEANRVAVDALFFRDEVRAAEATGHLRNDQRHKAVAAADRSPVPVPKGLLPRKTLENYLGPTASRTATRMNVGDVSGPIRTAGGYWVLRVQDREPGNLRPFEEVRDAIASLVQRNETDRLLQAWLKGARSRAKIHIGADVDSPNRKLSDQAVQEVLRARMGEDLPAQETGDGQ